MGDRFEWTVRRFVDEILADVRGDLRGLAALFEGLAVQSAGGRTMDWAQVRFEHADDARRTVRLVAPVGWMDETLAALRASGYTAALQGDAVLVEIPAGGATEAQRRSVAAATKAYCEDRQAFLFENVEALVQQGAPDAEEGDEILMAAAEEIDALLQRKLALIETF